MRDWREVKDIIEAEIDKIWFDMPTEIYLAQKGIFPSGAGTEGMNCGNLVFMLGDSECLGWLLAEYPMYAMLHSEEISLDFFKRFFKEVNGDEVVVLGGSLGPGSKCPGAWLNLPKILKFYNMVVEAYDSITTKEEMHSLIWSYYKYVDRMSQWCYVIFPWEVVGQLSRVVTGDDIPEDMLALCKECGIIEE